MSDIEKLIERLRATRVDVYAGPEAADALTRLVAPLPAEVAEEAGYLRMLAKAAVPDLPHVTLPDSLRDIADMLESLARENARLAAELAQERLVSTRLRSSWREDTSELKAELAAAKPLIEAGVAFQRGPDGIGQTAGHPGRRLLDAAKEYGRHLDAKKGGA